MLKNLFQILVLQNVFNNLCYVYSRGHVQPLMFIFFDSINNNFTSVLNVILRRPLIANKTVFCLNFRLIMCTWFYYYPFNFLRDAIVHFASKICIGDERWH